MDEGWLPLLPRYLPILWVSVRTVPPRQRPREGKVATLRLQASAGGGQ